MTCRHHRRQPPRACTPGGTKTALAPTPLESQVSREAGVACSCLLLTPLRSAAAIPAQSVLCASFDVRREQTRVWGGRNAKGCVACARRSRVHGRCSGPQVCEGLGRSRQALRDNTSACGWIEEVGRGRGRCTGVRRSKSCVVCCNADTNGRQGAKEVM